jgi:small subunit ribosomal protein S10
MVNRQKIRVIMKAYDHRLLDTWVREIINAAERTGARVSGPIPLPTSINRFCVIRSPHVHKKSREHFELRTHNRLIDILDANNKTMDSLTKLSVSAGVDISMK